MNRAIPLRFCFSSRADSHSAQLLSWHDDARCRAILPLPLPRRTARKAGALGSLWSSSMRAWNNVSARLHSAAAVAWPLSHSLTPVSPLWPTTCCCFCFWTLHRIKATAAARQQPAGTWAEGRKGPARASIVLVSIVSIPRRL